MPWVILFGVFLWLLVPLGTLSSFAAHTSFWQALESPYFQHLILFTFQQAFLSAGISLILGALLARSLFFLPQAWTQWLEKLLGLPLVIPGIVVVMLIINTFGHQGFWPLEGLYGLKGILLAHVFFNFPLAAKLLLPAWQAISPQDWRLVQNLNLTPWQVFRFIEWPQLQVRLVGVFFLIFMLCFTSFVVVLALGGGPQATTLEVAIYQALRFDFDLGFAAQLALVQLMIVLTLSLVLKPWMQWPKVAFNTLEIKIYQVGWLQNTIHGVIFLLLGLFLMVPLLSLFQALFYDQAWLIVTTEIFWRSLLLSLIVALVAAFISLALAWFIAQKPQFELLASGIYIVSPMVIGTGWFIFLNPWVDPQVFMWPVLVVIHALMGLPFALRLLVPSLLNNQQFYGHLMASLPLKPWQRFYYWHWPMNRAAWVKGFALAAALSMGDMGVVALFGTPQWETLPLLLYQQLSAYHWQEAGVLALVLLLVTLGLFMGIEKLGQPHA